jgi:hypothetical protein
MTSLIRHPSHNIRQTVKFSDTPPGQARLHCPIQEQAVVLKQRVLRRAAPWKGPGNEEMLLLIAALYPVGRMQGNETRTMCSAEEREGVSRGRTRRDCKKS